MAHLPSAAAAEADDVANRARGALYGLAVGDALGMPTQMLSRGEITARWGGMLAGFEPAPPDHPLCPGRPAGTVTDDTEQAILLGHQVVAGRGTVDARRLAAALVAWEADMAARGSLDLLGPDDPWRACRLAASLGGDCDTIAAMAGAVSGACHGLAAFPAEATGVIHAQGLGLSGLADRLLRIRLIGSSR